MTTIMVIGSGESERRCDASCHDAHEPECDCICGGRFHGVGSGRAQELLRDDLVSGALGPELQHAAEAFAPPTLFEGPAGDEPASQEQWRRARTTGLSTRSILRLCKARRATDVSKRQLAELIEKRVGVEVS